MSLLEPHINGDVNPQARSGHTAVLYRGHMIVHGGYNETLASGRRSDMYMPASEIWAYDIELSKWIKRSTTGSFPASGISGATACVLDDCMIIFGGFGDSFGRLNLVFELNLKTFHWRNLTKERAIRGLYPSKRDKFVSWAHKNRLTFFGGFGPPPNSENGSNGEFCFDQNPWGLFGGIGWNSHLCVLDFTNLEKIQWKYPETGNEKPSPRAAHSGAKVRNRGYVFGGRHKDKRVNDMFYIDLDTFKWHKVNYNSPAPKGRSWHVMIKTSDDGILIHGGLDTEGNALSDMWLFDIESRQWNEIKDVYERLDGQKASRIWHTAVQSDRDGEIVIFGGCANSVLSAEPSSHCETVIIYRSSPLPLEQLCIQKVVNFESKKKLTNLPLNIKSRITPHLHLGQIPVHSSKQEHGACLIV